MTRRSRQSRQPTQPDQIDGEQISLTRIRADAADAPWLEEAAQAIAGRGQPCPLNARLESGDAGYWIRAETADGPQIVGALSGRITGQHAVWTWLAAAAQWRHYGFGGAAVPLFEQAAQQLGAREALVPLPRDNGVALYFWLRLGYVPARSPSLAQADLPPGIAPDAVWMRRPLSAPNAPATQR